MDKIDQRAVNIGFDIGISSVGWSVLDNKSGEIIDAGVNLFSPGTASENAERRIFRQSRRLIRRRKKRIADLKKVLQVRNIPVDGKIKGTNPYEIRVKGLTKQLSLEEIGLALVHIVKRRGISYSLVDNHEEEHTSGEYQKSILINQELLMQRTPAEIQLERLHKYGKVRGEVDSLSNKEVLLNVFPTQAYVDEVQKLLTMQAAYHQEITDGFIREVCQIITRKRPYFIGPGSKKSPTDYGIYRTNGEVHENLFEILIGKDKFFNEIRAANSSYSAQLFHLLNDLNALTFPDENGGKLTTAQKEAIISELRQAKANINMLQLVAKIAKIDMEKITGYRLNQKDKPEINSLSLYRQARRRLLFEGVDLSDWEISLLDELARIMTVNTENKEIRHALHLLSSQFPVLDEAVINVLIHNKAVFIAESNRRWHSFSLKTLHLLIAELLHTTKDQMEIITDLGLLDQRKRDYSEKTRIDTKGLTNEIYNPVVRKSVRKAIKVFNALWETYKNIDYVVIEMPRDGDELSVKKEQETFQKKNSQEKELALEAFKHAACISEAQLNDQLFKQKMLRQKIRYWYQQEGKCLYSGKAIAAKNLATDSHQFVIDHVLPAAVSFDDSMNNKVLCYDEMNRIKGKQTPYEFLKKGMGQSFKSFQEMVKQNKRLPKAKVRYLLFKEDVQSIEVRKRFVARNLVDTRYASRVVLNELQQFFLSRGVKTQVSVIRGKMTAKLREQFRVGKSCETYHYHAENASIIAAFPSLSLWKRGASYIPDKITETVMDLRIGDFVDNRTYTKEMYQLPYPKFVTQFTKLPNRIRFHHQVDKKMNRKVSDATIYSTRNTKIGKDEEAVPYIISKIKDIYDPKGYEKFRIIYNKDKSKFLMQQHDPQTFEKLEKIMQEYPDKIEQITANGSVKEISISPFAVYRQEHGSITKYAKKNNGPVIKSVKYCDNKLGSSIDITPKSAKKKRVVLRSLNSWRTDVYFNHTRREYELLGLKYCDLRFYKGRYGILVDDYLRIKQQEKVSNEAEFLFSLYRGDRIKVYDDNGEAVEVLFGARKSINQKNYVELKPVDKHSFEKKERLPLYGLTTAEGRLIKKLVPKGCNLIKINTDLLGKTYYLNKESDSPKNIIDPIEIR